MKDSVSKKPKTVVDCHWKNEQRLVERPWNYKMRTTAFRRTHRYTKNQYHLRLALLPTTNTLRHSLLGDYTLR